MEERSTLARPYAAAVFKIAQEDDSLDSWSGQLSFLAAAAADPQMKGVLGDPRRERTRIADFLIEVAGGRLTEKGQNLVRVLAANGRLELLAEIAVLYEEHKARAQRRERVHVVSAYAVNPKFEQAIAAAMEQRLGCAVELDTEVDRSLIGGVIIRTGDLVIDASLRGRLKHLAAQLT